MKVIEQIKQELYEMNHKEEHMALEPKVFDNPKEYFDELIKLSMRVGSQFKVDGDYRCFVVSRNPNNILLGILVALILTIPTGLLFQNISNIIYWLVEFITFGLIYVFFRYIPSSNDFEIDTYQKRMIIKSNNFIGKYIIPIIEIEFRDFKEFTSKEKRYDNYNIINRVYICFNDQQKRVIDLPNSLQCVNHKIFMDCLTTLIKNGAEHHV